MQFPSQGSFSSAQLYGNTQVAGARPTEPPITRASSPLINDNKVVYVWVAFVALILVYRYLYEMAD